MTILSNILRFSRLNTQLSIIRSYNKVAILGASGKVGQNLSLLLKYSPLIQELALYDIENVKGVAKDLSHISTKALVTNYQGVDEIGDCLKEADIVVLAAGAGRKPGMHRSDVFDLNASIVADCVTSYAKYCPEAMLCLLTNPINSTVPLAAEILKKAGVYNHKRLFGVITIDVMRANTFVANAKGLNVQSVQVPVVGGHSGNTIVPLLSQTVPRVSFKVEDRGDITAQIQQAGRFVVEAKQGQGSAWLAQSYSVSLFLNSLISAMDGKRGVVECAYVQSNVTESKFFASPILLGSSGIEENLGLGSLNEYEVKILRKAVPELIKDIDLGVQFAHKL